MIHIEDEAKSDWDAPDACVYTMKCGAQCLIFADGEPIPSGFDFYMEKDGDKATCPGCRAALAAPPARSMAEALL